MSKNISILQDSEEKTLKKVEKIKTQLANGNVCYWVPEDEYPLGVLTVTEDGVYYPSTDPNGPYYGYSEINVSGIGTTTMGQLADIVITKNGTYESSTDSSGPYYGYAKVTVNVSGSGDDGSGGGDGGSSSPTITGKDADGDDAIVGTDEDGNIVSEKLPSRISINVYPNNLVYEDGQTIDFTGLRVKAFLPDDTEWGIVDDNELIKPVTVAEYSGDGGGTGEWDVSGLGINSPIYMKPLAVGEYYEGEPEVTYSRYVTAMEASSTVYYIVFANSGSGVISGCVSLSAFRVTTQRKVPSGWSPQVEYFTSQEPTTVNGKSAYETGFNNVRVSSSSRISASQEGTGYSLSQTAVIALTGGSPLDTSQQTIPLQWKRPGDKKVLETSFTIAVHGSGDSGSSAGPAPTPSPG